MLEKKEFDVFIVACANDIKLLCHFFSSYRLFFKNPGKIHLFIWRKDLVLLEQIVCPNNLIIHFKDEVKDLVDDDFRNQMYLKLISNQYVKTEWYWIVDADYLINSFLEMSDFFCEDKPRWFYRSWLELPEKMWKHASELFIGTTIPYQFMDEPHYIFNRTILQDFQQSIDVRKILTCSLIPSEFVVYGTFAYQKHQEMYHWDNLDETCSTLISYRVNQIPPTYLVLNDQALLSDSKSSKYSIFWSHWDVAEEKMCQFLTEAQLKEFGEVRIISQPNLVSLSVTLESLNENGASAWDGQYTDGWVKKNASFALLAPCSGAIQLELDVPLHPNDNYPHLILTSSGASQRIELHSEINIISIPILKNQMNETSLKFHNENEGLLDGGRRLYAKIVSCCFHG